MHLHFILYLNCSSTQKDIRIESYILLSLLDFLNNENREKIIKMEIHYWFHSVCEYEILSKSEDIEFKNSILM